MIGGVGGSPFPALQRRISAEPNLRRDQRGGLTAEGVSPPRQLKGAQSVLSSGTRPAAACGDRRGARYWGPSLGQSRSPARGRRLPRPGVAKDAGCCWAGDEVSSHPREVCSAGARGVAADRRSLGVFKPGLGSFLKDVSVRPDALHLCAHACPVLSLKLHFSLCSLHIVGNLTLVGSNPDFSTV